MAEESPLVLVHRRLVRSQHFGGAAWCQGSPYRRACLCTTCSGRGSGASPFHRSLRLGSALLSSRPQRRLCASAPHVSWTRICRRDCCYRLCCTRTHRFACWRPRRHRSRTLLRLMSQVQRWPLQSLQEHALCLFSQNLPSSRRNPAKIHELAAQLGAQIARQCVAHFSGTLRAPVGRVARNQEE